jgi:hypothetical protein
MAEGHTPLPYEGFVVTHHFDGGTRPEKLERDKQLLEQDIIDSPGNVRSYFYLAQTYANLKLYDKAIIYYRERVNRGGWPEEVYYSMYQIGVMHYNLRQYDKAKLTLLDGYEYRPQRFECMYMLGVIAREHKQYAQAVLFQEKVVSMRYPADDVLFVHKNQWDYLAWFELGIDYYWRGDYIMAEKACARIENIPDVPEKIAKQNVENLRFARERLGKIKHEGPRPFVVASMFTVGTPYEVEVQKLKQSLDEHKVKYEIIGVRSQGSWERNTHLKPHVIKQVMEKHKIPVVWIDADAVVMKPLTFFEEVPGDISYHTVTWPNGFKEMLVGTIYFDNNHKTESFIDEWIRQNEHGKGPDGEVFQKIMETNPMDLNVTDLPGDYIKIFDNEHIKSSDPAIVHNQASRRFKKEVSIKKNEIIKTVLKGISAKAESCAIVGNGPYKTDLAEQINGSFVMRCNNFKTGAKYSWVGHRTDLNITSLNPEIVPKGKVSYPLFGVLPISNTMYQEYTNAKLMHTFWQQEAEKQLQLENTVLTYDEEDNFAGVFKSVAEEIGAFPTVGILAIATARWLEFEKIIVTGFTFFESKKSHYFHDKKVIPSTHHNVQAEKELLNKWRSENKIEYIFDELTLKALDNVKVKSRTA